MLTLDTFISNDSVADICDSFIHLYDVFLTFFYIFYYTFILVICDMLQNFRILNSDRSSFKIWYIFDYTWRTKQIPMNQMNMHDDFDCVQKNVDFLNFFVFIRYIE